MTVLQCPLVDECYNKHIVSKIDQLKDITFHKHMRWVIFFCASSCLQIKSFRFHKQSSDIDERKVIISMTSPLLRQLGWCLAHRNSPPIFSLSQNLKMCEEIWLNPLNNWLSLIILETLIKVLLKIINNSIPLQA